MYCKLSISLRNAKWINVFLTFVFKSQHLGASSTEKSHEPLVAPSPLLFLLHVAQNPAIILSSLFSFLLCNLIGDSHTMCQHCFPVVQCTLVYTPPPATCCNKFPGVVFTPTSLHFLHFFVTQCNAYQCRRPQPQAHEALAFLKTTSSQWWKLNVSMAASLTWQRTFVSCESLVHILLPVMFLKLS